MFGPNSIYVTMGADLLRLEYPPDADGLPAMCRDGQARFAAPQDCEVHVTRPHSGRWVVQVWDAEAEQYLPAGKSYTTEREAVRVGADITRRMERINAAQG